jgi:FkbM family methyltransferase
MVPAMTLPFRDWLTMLTPPQAYYRRRIRLETGEPELSMLAELMPGGGIAVDVGANQGFFAFALSEVADRVVAFEPNPDYALFARWMLRGRAEVHAFALSNRAGRATFHVPVADDGVVMHFAGSLQGGMPEFATIRTYDVELKTLDSFGLTGVSLIKVDVEGTERDVLDGGRTTIMRDRPVLVVELLSGAHQDPHAMTEAIGRDFGYDAYVVQDAEKRPALPVIASLGQNSTYNTEYESRNVLFLPKR